MKHKKTLMPSLTTNLVGAQFQSLTTNLVGLVRNETLEGRPYVVVPMVMIVEGVLNGSNGPLYYPAEELAKVPQVWNMKPVVVYHPQMNGKALSACDPSVIENYKVGMIMNTTFDGKRLKAEAWLEPSRLAVVDNRVQEALDAGTMMEVSTGLFTENEMVDGTHNGAAYVGIARNYRPDHLAILPDQIGACSIDDGAGLLRINSRNDNNFRLLLNKLHINSDMSHDDIRSAIYTALETGQEKNTWIIDVFDDYFIFESNTGIKKQNYKMDGAEAKLEGLAVDVRRVTTYEEITSNTTNEGNEKMNKEQVVNSLIANGKWDEKDREFLMGLNEAHLEKLIPETNSDDPSKTADPAKPATAKTTQNKGAKTDEGKTTAATKPAEEPETNKKVETPVTVDSYLANAPAEIREVMNEAMQTQASKKQELIGIITANKKNTFTNDQLASLSVNELSSIAALAKVDAPASSGGNYSGQASVGNASNGATEEEPLEAPVMNFDQK